MPRRKGGAYTNTSVDYAAVEDILVPYRRVSTREQAMKGYGLPAQLTVLKAGLKFREQRALTWGDEIVDKGKSGDSMQRAGLQNALKYIRAGQAGGIIVAKLDRLSRSLLDFAHLMVTADKEGWNIVALDVGVDLKTPAGKAMAGMLAVFAEFERNVIAMRTKDGLAEKRAQGVVLGRPKQIEPDLTFAIVGAYLLEGNYSKVARWLTEAGTPTVQGGKMWYPKVVRDIVLSEDGRKLMEQLEDAA